MKKIVAILIFSAAFLWADRLENIEKCNAGDAQACYEIKDYQKACDLGLAEVCYEEKDYRKACDFGIVYVEKCKAGDTQACLRIKNYAKTHNSWIEEACYEYATNDDSKYYRRVCELNPSYPPYYNSPINGCKAAVIYGGNVEERQVWLRKMCLDEGKVDICVVGLGTVSLISGDERDEFIQKLTQKCDEYHSRACSWLGNYMIDIKNVTKAREFFQKACNAGATGICEEYELTQDMSKSEPILEKACESGNTEACLKLGAYYDKNDYKKAMEFYQKVCDLGDTKTCSKLGAEYWFKAGCILGISDKQSCAEYHLVATEEPSKKAKEFYKKSCDLGNELGCSAFYLYDATSYNIGLGVSQDIAKAKELYKKVCDDFKDETACKNFERLSK